MSKSQKNSTTKTHSEIQNSVCVQCQPRLCPFCEGKGVILEGFCGLPMFCSVCNGDGIERRQ